MRLTDGLHIGKARAKLRFRFGATRDEPTEEIDPAKVEPWASVFAARRRENGETGAVAPAPLSGGPAETPWARLQKIGGLARGGAGNLNGDGRTTFVTIRHDDCIPRPAALPSVAHEGRMHLLVPATIEVPDRLRPCVSARLAREAVAEGAPFVPDDFQWPDTADILAAIEEHETLVAHAQTLRDARALLARERRPSAELYASMTEADEAAPMLVDGLMRERGVSVVYGGFDEFKTTVVLDIMAHLATGAPWQGRKVSARPVIWYALDGADDIALRLRAFESGLRNKDAPWGRDRAPISVRRRIPDSYLKWRAEICRIAERWGELAEARHAVGEIAADAAAMDRIERPPVIVVDPLSMALGNAFEQGPQAGRFIQECLDLLRERRDLAAPDNAPAGEPRKREHAELPVTIDWPVASHVILIHPQATARTEFDGPGAILANTQALYRVHRFGEIDDVDRPAAGQITPMRMKGMTRPAPVRFAVKAAPIEGTAQTAAVLQDKDEVESEAARPVTGALRDRDPDAPDACLDRAPGVAAKKTEARRKARDRVRPGAQDSGVAEPAEDDDGTVASYRFHDRTEP